MKEYMKQLVVCYLDSYNLPLLNPYIICFFKKGMTNSSTLKLTLQSCKACTHHALNQVQNSLCQPCSRKLSLYQQTPIFRTKILALYLLQISYDFNYRLVTHFFGLMNNVDFSRVVCHVSILPC